MCVCFFSLVRHGQHIVSCILVFFSLRRYFYISNSICGRRNTLSLVFCYLIHNFCGAVCFSFCLFFSLSIFGCFFLNTLFHLFEQYLTAVDVNSLLLLIFFFLFNFIKSHKHEIQFCQVVVGRRKGSLVL